MRSCEPANAANAVQMKKNLKKSFYNNEMVIQVSRNELIKLKTKKKQRKTEEFIKYLPVGFKPPVFDGAIPAKPSAANPANGFFVKPLIYINIVVMLIIGGE